MLGHIIISLVLAGFGAAIGSNIVVVMSIVLLLAPFLGKFAGIGWSEFSPRVVVICLLIIVAAVIFWNA